MQRALGLILVVVLATMTTGCIDSSTVVAVKKDGSGYITETVFMLQDINAMMGAMMGGMGDGDVTVEAEASPLELDPEQARARAKQMGEGVTFVGQKDVKNAKGKDGKRAIYAFTDVRKLRISPGGGLPGGAMEMEPEADSADVITFGFTPGTTPELVINVPQQEEAAGADMAGDDAEVMGGGEMAAAAMMFAGLRIRVLVKVDGEIDTFTATHVSASAKTGKRQFVTLLDLKFDDLMADPKGMKMLGGMGGAAPPSAAALAGLPGMTIETQPRVAVTFR